MSIMLKFAGLLLGVLCCHPSFANEPTKANEAQPRLEAKADAARQLSRETEAAQLQKASEASVQGDVRMKQTLKKTLKAQQHSDWQSQQQLKAEQGFKQRESREQRYLEEAKKAAGQEKKLIIKKQAVATEEQ